MTHSSNASNGHLPPAWQWWLAIVAGLTAMAFGAYGLRLYEQARPGGDPNDAASILYHTLQLFALHSPHLEDHVPWQLSVGRWLSAGVILAAVARSLGAVFRSECRLFWSRFRGGHVVVCGLGPAGQQLAGEFRQAGHRVVVVARKNEQEHLAEAYHAGVAVVTGDACAAKTLRLAGSHKALRIVVACDDDRHNVAIAAGLGKLRKATSSPAAECWLFVGDRWLRQMLRQEGVFPNAGARFRVNVRGLDFFEMAARRVFTRVPLDFDRIRPEDKTVVHLVICGFGSMGQHLALQAARIGHFANGEKLKITVLEPNGCGDSDRFLLSCPWFNRICRFEAVPVGVSEGRFDPEAVIRAIPAGAAGRELVTVAACWESPPSPFHAKSDFFERLAQNDAANLSLGLALASSHALFPQVLVFQTRRGGFGALLPPEGGGPALGVGISAFGMVEDTWSVKALLHEQEDEIARALHEDYLDKQIASGKKPGSRPALFDWEKLHERFRESNRRAADHIRVKLRAIGLSVSPLRDDRPSVSEFDKDQIRLLARMEHESWRADWMLQGYTYAPGERDDVARTQPYLVEWEQLPADVQKWDDDRVNAIPAALKRAGYAIYPQVQ